MFWLLFYTVRIELQICSTKVARVGSGFPHSQTNLDGIKISLFFFISHLVGEITSNYIAHLPQRYNVPLKLSRNRKSFPNGSVEIDEWNRIQFQKERRMEDVYNKGQRVLFRDNVQCSFFPGNHQTRDNLYANSYALNNDVRWCLPTRPSGDTVPIKSMQATERGLWL